MFKFSKKSLSILSTVKAPLELVVKEAISYNIIDITVAEGIRTIEKQKEYFEQGRTTTMNSKHLTGDAVDIYPYIKGRGMINDNQTTEDLIAWHQLAVCMKIASQQLEVPIKWGGDWQSFVDMPHFELVR